MSNKNLDFGFLAPYVADDKVTDINFNGKTLWIDHLDEGRFSPIVTVSSTEVETLCYKIANFTNKQFNNTFPILESELNNMRISIIHKSVAVSGYSISLRKNPPVIRLKREELINSSYVPSFALDFLEACVSCGFNIIVSGQPGVGKTELLKYFTNFIPAHKRVITIEDSLEVKYPIIQPFKDGVSLKVNEIVSYRDAIKASLRQRPDYILLSEVRSEEVVDLLQSVSTGSKMLTTIHAKSAQEIPKRMLHMFPGIELSNERLLAYIHSLLDVGIQLALRIDEEGIHRYVKSVYYYELVDDDPKSICIYDAEKEYFHVPETISEQIKCI